MKKIFSLVFFLFCTLYITAQEPQSINPITKELQYEMQQAAENDLFRINIRMKDQYDTEALLKFRFSLKPNELRDYVVNELRSFTAQSQQGILTELNYYYRSGEVNEIRSLWIVNVINCYATSEVIEQLATRPDVVRIDIDEERVLIYPEYGITQDGSDGSKEITYNVLKVNAPAVWDLGFTGQDVIVGVLDTGVRYTHNDLNGNMWTHPDYPYHGWNFINNTNNPNDDHGHGTHCAGTIAGNGASGSQTGIAPNAKIMALKILNNSGNGTESGVWAGIQFAIENGAHILSMSLGWYHSWNPDRKAWRITMANTLASGVIASVVAGNEGGELYSYPVPDNIRTPGDCPPPWLHTDQTASGEISAVVCVGATNINDELADFSSQGPVTWQSIATFNDYKYVPGTGLIRPDIVAPGVDVKSLSHMNNTSYTTMSGTSMATPCVAGIMALMISANQNITPEAISQILEETAVKFSLNKNNTFGSGRVNALAAIEATTFIGPAYAYHSFNDITGNSDGLINPSEFIQMDLALKNFSNYTYTNVNVVLTTDSPHITIVDGNEYFGTFTPKSTIEITDAFSFQVSDDIPGGHEIRFFIKTTDGDESWQSYFNVSAHAPNLTSGNITVYDPQGNGNGNLDPGESATLKIPTLNVGQISSEPVNVTLSTDSEYVTILNGSISLELIPANESMIVDFPVIVSESALIGQNIAFTYTIISESYIVTKTYDQKIGVAYEGFETGDFLLFPWSFISDNPWTIANDTSINGVFSAKSGVVSHNQSSELIIDYDVAVDDSISFYYKVSSEPDYDFLKFYINNQLVGQWSGNVPWTKAEFYVTKGLKKFKWEYTKDALISNNDDCAWIDCIIFPALASCPSPKHISATSVTASSAILNWTPGGSETSWDIIWGISGFDPITTGTIIPNLTSHPYTLTDLNSVTTYDCYVRSNCNDSDISEWNGPISFTTICGVYPLPFNEFFGNSSVICWSFPQGQGNWKFGSSYTPPSSSSGAPNAYFYWSPSSNYYSYSLVSPVISALNFSEIKLDFKLFLSNYSSSSLEQMSVEYKTINSSVWTLLENFKNLGIGNASIEFIRTNQTLNEMAGEEFQIRFRAHGVNTNNINGWGLDDIHIHGIGLPTILLGDSNCDGIVDILDIITTVSYVMDHNPQPFCFENADVNSDGIIDILDVIGTTNIVFSGKKSSDHKINSTTAHVYLNSTGIELESDGTLAGLQFQIDGLEDYDLNFLMKSHEYVSTMKNGKLKGVIFSYNNTPIPAGKINLFKINNKYSKALFTSVMAGNLNAHEVEVRIHQLEEKHSFNKSLINTYPNPSKGWIIIDIDVLKESNIKIIATDIYGRSILNFEANCYNPGKQQITVNKECTLSPGLYILRVNVIPFEEPHAATATITKLIITE